MDQAIMDFLQSKRIAIVGVSRSGTHFGNSIFKELKEKGYDMFIVHPEAKEIDGETCYPNLEVLQGKIDSVIVCVPPKQAEQVVRDAVKAGVKQIWLQQGSHSPQVKAVCQELGVTPVYGKCIMMYAQPVKSFHGWHRALAKVFGQV
jgi:predicted CoA-binding protein